MRWSRFAVVVLLGVMLALYVSGAHGEDDTADPSITADEAIDADCCLHEVLYARQVRRWLHLRPDRDRRRHVKSGHEGNERGPALARHHHRRERGGGGQQRGQREHNGVFRIGAEGRGQWEEI